MTFAFASPQARDFPDYQCELIDVDLFDGVFRLDISSQFLCGRFKISAQNSPMRTGGKSLLASLFDPLLDVFFMRQTPKGQDA